MLVKNLKCVDFDGRTFLCVETKVMTIVRDHFSSYVFCSLLFETFDFGWSIRKKNVDMFRIGLTHH